MRQLTPESLAKGIERLGQIDPVLARIYAEHGSPPLWQREQTFATLLLIVLEQKISLASARAVYQRIESLISPLTPANYQSFSDEEIFTTGISRAKISYVRNIAQAILNGSLVLEELPDLPEDEARQQLLRIKGIGPWTANVYLLMALGKLDIWPLGDRALAVAVQRAQSLPTVPKNDELEKLGEPYRPHRSIAAFLYWHFYLSA